MQKQYYIYIMTNRKNTVIYTGITSNLKKRIYEHKKKTVPGFTRKYNIDKLIYCEIFDDAYNAITREKRIKGGSRQKKMNLVNTINPKWKDLYDDL